MELFLNFANFRNLISKKSFLGKFSTFFRIVLIMHKGSATNSRQVFLYWTLCTVLLFNFNMFIFKENWVNACIRIHEILFAIIQGAIVLENWTNFYLIDKTENTVPCKQQPKVLTVATNAILRQSNFLNVLWWIFNYF